MKLFVIVTIICFIYHSIELNELNFNVVGKTQVYWVLKPIVDSKAGEGEGF